MRRRYWLLLLVVVGSGVVAYVLLSQRMTADYELHPENVTLISKVTGPDSVNQTDSRYKVGGTDLGIIWDAGQSQTMIVFGDTFADVRTAPGGGPGSTDWRSNILALSTDRNLEDGLQLDSMIEDVPGHAMEILPAKKINLDEITVIPTAGITVGERHYIHYMSVNNWGAPGSWYTNYSGIAYSDDRGQTWTKDPDIRWINTPTWTSNFQMAAFAKSDDFVYMVTTPNGRFGAAYLARVPQDQVLAKSQYQYWNGQTWVTDDEQAATPIVGSPVSELSVQYNTHFNRWLMLYFDPNRYALVLRDAQQLTGPWSVAKVVATGSEYPQLYGGYIHPWFNDGEDLYFTMSQWQPYNVFLVKVHLTKASK